MTSPQQTKTPATDTETCMCGHEWSLHDKVATRYCEATRDHARVRGCICQVAKA